MNIQNFKNNILIILKEKDENERIIGYQKLTNIQIIGRNFYYPNVLLLDEKKEIINPYDEKVMSLNKESFYDNNIYEDEITAINNKKIINENVFFFIYNFDNYYHFLYDTLPYLYTYFELKKKHNDLKLLVNYPNKDKNEFYKFNTDFLYKLVDQKDIIIHKKNNIYKNIFISTSLTHGGLSNKPPRKEIFEIYKKLKTNINIDNIQEKYKNMKNIYISRRTWLNEDKSNIGTDYTSRRKMVNETELVEELKKYKFEEIFAENLNSDEKIYLFSNAEKIVGSIGGGMANLLYSNKNTKSYIIVSPYFLDINYRFKYSLDNTDIQYFDNTEVVKKDNSKYSNYVRVKIINKESLYYNKIGEIIDFENNLYKIALSNNDVAGFNNKIKFEEILFEERDFTAIDKGLNSPYYFNYSRLIKNID
tara:strand:+ start:4353 stop:5612 length:1260 start_codon:yes stop_codon:yes gene_type:complete